MSDHLDHSLLPESSAEEPPSEVPGYESISELGRGGVGVVTLAREGASGRQVALKRLRERTPARLASFLREASTIRRLRHPAVVRLEEVIEHGDEVVLVLEHLPGPDLATWVQTRGPFETGRALSLTRAVAQALAYAHRHGVVHRDVKPSNVLLTGSGGAKLTDFGLALTADLNSMTATADQGPVGSVEYMAPEQWSAASRVDARADVYGLGATLYFLVTGHSPRVIRPDRLPAELRSFVLRCLEEDPADRFDSMTTLLAALEALCAEQRRVALEAPGRASVAASVAGVLGGTLLLFGLLFWVGARALDEVGVGVGAAHAAEQETARIRARAEAGDPGAMNLLGFRLLTGTGCAADPAGAYRWGERAARLGHAEAMYGIAMMLEQGRGIPRDEAKAVMWYRRAVAAGDTMAGPALADLLRRRPDLAGD